MAEENAAGKLLGQLKGEDALQEMQKRFSLAHTPARIEGFDISNLGGGLAVGSQVVFEDGETAKDRYRRYRIKTVQGMDDYAMLYEVLVRRLRRGQEEGDLPDLILIDGGKGQLSAARAILESLGLQIPVIGLAKRQEEIFIPDRDEPLVLDEASASLRILEAVRNESHRFATKLNKKRRTKRLTLAVLEGVPGIGATRSRRLMEAFGSVDAILEATPEELQKRAGLSRETAATLLARLSQRRSTPAGAEAGHESRSLPT
jgi:excinuclease ABC subunit C